MQSLGWEDTSEKQPTAVFLPGKSHGQRSLAGYSPRGHKRAGHDLATKRTSTPCAQPVFPLAGFRAHWAQPGKIFM